MKDTNVQFLWNMARQSAKDVQELKAIVADLQNQIEELKAKRGPGRPKKIA